MTYLVCVSYYDNYDRHVESFLIKHNKKITTENFNDFRNEVITQLIKKVSDINSSTIAILAFSKLEK